MRKCDLHAVSGDWHCPDHEPAAVNAFIEWAAEHQPSVVHLNGDIADFYAVSSFRKDPHRAAALQDEIDTTREWLGKLRSAVPKARIIYLEGNHEFRPKKFALSRAAEMYGLRDLQVPYMLRLSDLDIEWREKPYLIHGRGMLITHGTLVRKESCYSAKAAVERAGVSLIMGHTHRAGHYWKTTLGGTLQGVENGCLCRLDMEYVVDGVANWQQCFSALHLWGRNCVQVEQKPIWEGEMLWDSP